MVNIFSYEKVIYAAIAASIGINQEELRVFPNMSAVPNDDKELFNLFNTIPDSDFVFYKNKEASYFSMVYGDILKAQEKSFINNIAIKKFETSEYWLTDQLNKIPKYTPSNADILAAIDNGSRFSSHLDSLEYKINDEILFPSFPNLIIDKYFLELNQTINHRRFVLNLTFDKVALLAVRPSGWYNSASFISAYNNKEKWISEKNPITWDSLFGATGILKFIFNGILIASGMNFEIQMFGKYDQSVIDTIKNYKNISIWPFYVDSENLKKNYMLASDGSLKITVQSPSNEILLLAMQVQSVKNLLGQA